MLRFKGFFPGRILFACLLFSNFMLPRAVLLAGDEGGSLVQKYLRAHEAEDLESLKALVWWQGSTERTREIIEAKLKKYLGHPIKEIEIRPLSGKEGFTFKGYRPNLKPVAWLAISFESFPEDSRFRGQAFVVGEKDGEQRISVAVPADVNP